MSKDKWEKVIWWFIKTFLITKKDKKESERYKIEEEKKKKLAMEAKAEAKKRREYLIKKYRITPTRDRIYVGAETELRVNSEDFMKIIIEEEIMKFFTFVPPVNGDIEVYADCPYYFYIDGVCIITEVSSLDNGSIKNFISLLFDSSPIKLSRESKKTTFGLFIEEVIVQSSIKELRKYLTKEVKKV